MTAAELSKLVNDITSLGYKVTDLLNRHIESGDATEEQLTALRIAAAFLGSANGVVWEQYVQVKETEVRSE